MANWGSAGGGFAQGLLTGSQVGRNIAGAYNESKQMGLMEDRQKLLEQQTQEKIQREKEQQAFDNDYKMAQWGTELAKNTKLPKATQLVGLNNIVRFHNKHVDPANTIPEFDELPDYSAKLATKVQAIDKSNLSLQDKQKAMLDLIPEFEPEHKDWLLKRSDVYSKEVDQQTKAKHEALYEKDILSKIKERKESSSVDDTYKKTQARLQAKIDSLEKNLGRPLTEEEKRLMYFQDPYGIAAPTEETPLPVKSMTKPKQNPFGVTTNAKPETPTSGAKPLTGKSKSGKPIVSYDGGVTWEYK